MPRFFLLQHYLLMVEKTVDERNEAKRITSNPWTMYMPCTHLCCFQSILGWNWNDLLPLSPSSCSCCCCVWCLLDTRETKAIMADAGNHSQVIAAVPCAASKFRGSVRGGDNVCRGGGATSVKSSGDSAGCLCCCGVLMVFHKALLWLFHGSTSAGGDGSRRRCSLLE